MGRVDWPFDLTDSDAARFFCFNQCNDNNGVMLEMGVVSVASGIECLRGLFKYHAPIPNSLGMAYVGILWLAFEACRYQIKVESMELGDTGLREAVVMMMEGGQMAATKAGENSAHRERRAAPGDVRRGAGAAAAAVAVG